MWLGFDRPYKYTFTLYCNVRSVYGTWEVVVLSDSQKPTKERQYAYLMFLIDPIKWNPYYNLNSLDYCVGTFAYSRISNISSEFLVKSDDIIWVWTSTRIPHAHEPGFHIIYTESTEKLWIQIIPSHLGHNISTA